MEKRNLIGFLVFALAISLTFGCGNRERREVQSVPADSPLAKVQRGMGMQQVQDTIGMWNDHSTHVSGKAWIPFYFGSDRINEVYYYKGLGRVIASGSGRVIRVEYDPNEDGYR